MKKLINIIFIGILLISCIGNVLLLNRLENKTNELIQIYNVEPELIIVDSLVYDTVYTEKKEIVKLPIVDTLVLIDTVVAVAVDSVFVEIPIEYKHYSDTLAKTAISFDLSGYNCKVNNLYVKNFLNVPTQEKAVKRWYEDIHLGIGLGVTYIDRFRICPNIGLYYKLM